MSMNSTRKAIYNDNILCNTSVHRHTHGDSQSPDNNINLGCNLYCANDTIPSVTVKPIKAQRMEKLTDTEIRVLRSLHLQGHMGNCGSLNSAQRLKLLTGLIKKGMLTPTGHVTIQGINASRPAF